MTRKRRAPEPTINQHAAAQLMGRSVQILCYWVKTKRIKPVSMRRPYRFRVADVLEAAAGAPPPRAPRGAGSWGRPRGTAEIDHLVKEITDK